MRTDENKAIKLIIRALMEICDDHIREDSGIGWKPWQRLKDDLDDAWKEVEPDPLDMPSWR